MLHSHSHSRIVDTIFKFNVQIKTQHETQRIKFSLFFGRKGLYFMCFLFTHSQQKWTRCSRLSAQCSPLCQNALSLSKTHRKSVEYAVQTCFKHTFFLFHQLDTHFFLDDHRLKLH